MANNEKLYRVKYGLDVDGDTQLSSNVGVATEWDESSQKYVVTQSEPSDLADGGDGLHNIAFDLGNHAGVHLYNSRFSQTVNDTYQHVIASLSITDFMAAKSFIKIQTTDLSGDDEHKCTNYQVMVEGDSATLVDLETDTLENPSPQSQNWTISSALVDGKLQISVSIVIDEPCSYDITAITTVLNSF